MSEAYTRNWREVETLKLFRAIVPGRRTDALDILQRAAEGDDITPWLFQWFEASGFTSEETAERLERVRVHLPPEAAR